MDLSPSTVRAIAGVGALTVLLLGGLLVLGRGGGDVSPLDAALSTTSTAVVGGPSTIAAPSSSTSALDPVAPSTSLVDVGALPVPSSAPSSASTSTTETTAAPSDPSSSTTPSTAAPSTEQTSTSADSTPTTPSVTTTTSTTVASAPSSSASGPPADACGLVIIEAEDLSTSGAWKTKSAGSASGGRYITWEGLSPERHSGQPVDVINHRFTIERAGTYRFSWRMRQPGGVAGDRANDSWLNFPDAARYGPFNGGRYPGFIKVFGRARNGFAYAGTADVNHNKTEIGIEFDRPGTYTMQLAGRSHGHQIDRIVIHHESIRRAAVAAGATC